MNNESDPFLDNPLHCKAVGVLLDGMPEQGSTYDLQAAARGLRNGPLLDSLPEAQRSVVAVLAVTRAVYLAEEIELQWLTV